MTNNGAVLKVGLVGGILYFLTALIPNSTIWPLLWPGLAGIFLIFLMRKRGNLNGYSHAAVALLKTGFLLAIVFFALTLVAFYLLELPQLDQVSSYLGSDGSMEVTGTVIIGLLIAAGLGLVLTWILGSVVYPFLKK